jgi:hypothetical protein
MISRSTWTWRRRMSVARFFGAGVASNVFVCKTRSFS